MGAPVEEVTGRTVFDTPVVVSALLFRRGHLSWLRSHWAGGGCIPLISHNTAQEFTAVLRRSKFRLTVGEVHETLAAYLPFCEVVEVTRRCATVCRYPKDQPFLDLAESGGAESLVSGDRDLLALAGKTRFRIEDPAAYRLRVVGV